MAPKLMLAGALAAMLLVACGAPPTREQAGTVAGGIAGGVVGSEITGHGTAGAIVGTLVGAAIGGLAGRAMDDNDRRQTVRALETVPHGPIVELAQSGHRQLLRGDACADL